MTERNPIPNAGHPPTAHLCRAGRVLYVHDHVDLVVLLVPRLEIRGAGGQVGVLTIHPPQAVAAPGIGPGGIQA